MMAVPSSTNSSLIWSSNLLEALDCPVLKEPFVKAQIVNCSFKHSFSLEAVTKIFGNMIEDLCETSAPCPICQSKVTAYWPNNPLQALVNAILAPKVEQITNPINTAKYPFKPVSFQLIKAKYDFNDAFRDLEFKPEHAEDITNLDLSIDRQKGSSGKKYTIGISLKDSISAIRLNVALRQIDIMASEIKKTILYKTNDSQELIRIIEFFKSNNQVQEDLKTELEDFLQEVKKGKPKKGSSLYHN